MRQLCKYLVVLSLFFTTTINYTMLDTSNVTKFGCGCGPCCSPCGGGCGCGTCCSPCGGGCGCGSCCGPCGGGCGCGPCCEPCGGGCTCGGSTCCGTCCSTCGPCCWPCCDPCCQASACGYPFFAYRSTSINAARDIVGIQQWINRYDMDTTSGAFSIALEYTRSFRPSRIAQFLFGCDLMGCNTLAIQGSRVTEKNSSTWEKRLSCAWLADYFGLSPYFDSRVSFCPRIENVIVNLDLYIGLDEATEGLYLRIHSPLTWTRWSLNMCECIKNYGFFEGDPIGFPPTYMAATPISDPTPGPNYHGEITHDKLPQSFTEAISGCATWGDMQSPLCFGRMTPCRLKCIRLADIHSVIGWNFVRDEDYHCGLNVRVVVPTSKRPCATYLFEPQVGDRKHWQLGVGLTSSYCLWRNEENDDNYLKLYFDANFLHLFKTCQCRSFDFCCKPNSRYMLLAEMGSNDRNTIYGENEAQEDTKANYQYKRSLIPAINYTTYNINVSIGLQADLALTFGYVNNNWSWDFGYNLWARTGEKFCMSDNCCCCCECPEEKTYAIKGDALLYGSTWSVDGLGNSHFDDAYPLSISQCKADIHSGENAKLDDEPDYDRTRNKGVDNPQLAYLEESGSLTPLVSELTDVTDPKQIYTSIQPKIINCNDINFCKSPGALSHKIFAHFSYAWKDREENWTPYLGIGGEVECDCGCNACRFAVSQWGLWLKGGVAFE